MPAALEHLKLFVDERAGLAGKSATLAVSCPALLVFQPIIDAAIPTLVQLLRNAVEHGVETPVERLVAGKSLTAAIDLRVTLLETGFLVRISDDGAGIDHAAAINLECALRTVSPGGRTAVEADARRAFFLRQGIGASVRTGRSGNGLERAVARIAPFDGALSFATKAGTGSTFSLSMDCREDFIPADALAFADLGGSAASSGGLAC